MICKFMKEEIALKKKIKPGIFSGIASGTCAEAWVIFDYLKNDIKKKKNKLF